MLGHLEIFKNHLTKLLYVFLFDTSENIIQLYKDDFEEFFTVKVFILRFLILLILEISILSKHDADHL